MGVSVSMAKCEKKLVKCKSGLKIVPVNESCRSPFLLKEPSWVPDDEVVDASVLWFVVYRSQYCLWAYIGLRALQSAP